MANMKIQEVEGIGPALGAKLQEAGIVNTDTLLEKCCTKQGRKALSEKTGMSEQQVLKFVNMADLFRVKGIGAEYAELLKSSGVDTVVELAARRADNLTSKMAEVNEAKKLTRRVPSEKVVQGWVEAAKTLPRKIEH